MTQMDELITAAIQLLIWMVLVAAALGLAEICVYLIRRL